MAVSINLSITQNSQSKSDLTSKVTVTLKCSWTYGSFNLNNPKGTVTIDGTEYDFDHDINPNRSTSGSGTIFTKTLNIKHNDTTGKKTLNCSASFKTGVSSGTVTDSASKTLSQLPTIDVKYNANGGSGAPSSQLKYYDVAFDLSSTKPTRTSYSFVGWGTSSSDTTSNYSPGKSVTRTSDLNLYAIWKKTITLSFNANSGTGAPSSTSATVYNATTSKTFTISTTKPTRTGYNFLGWSKSSTATSASYSAGGSITLSASDTLYAVWQIKTYNVTYNANGGSGTPSNQTKTYGKTLTLSTTKPTRTGYTFLGWSTSSSATSATYASGGSYATNAELKLYAVWKLNTYTVSYNANGGSGAPSNQTKTHGVTLVLSTTKPTKTGYNFVSWNTKSNGTGTTYQSGGKYTTESPTTLYAIWKLKTYTISYNANGGSGAPSSQTKTYGVNLTLRSGVPTRSGYRFLGWSTSSTSETVTYQPSSTFTTNVNTTLYAVWEQLGIMSINIDGTWSDGKVWVNVNGEWKTGLIFVNVNNAWKQGGV